MRDTLQSITVHRCTEAQQSLMGSSREQTWLMLTERSQQSKGSCSFARMSSGVDSACHRLGAGAYLHATREDCYIVCLRSGVDRCRHLEGPRQLLYPDAVTEVCWSHGRST